MPDMAGTMEHIRKQKDVRILKDAGEKDESGVVASFLGKGSGEGEDEEFARAVEKVAFVEDPDGYLIEVFAG